MSFFFFSFANALFCIVKCKTKNSYFGEKESYLSGQIQYRGIYAHIE